jgi:hypothetical protein
MFLAKLRARGTTRLKERTQTIWPTCFPPIDRFGRLAWPRPAQITH